MAPPAPEWPRRTDARRVRRVGDDAARTGTAERRGTSMIENQKRAWVRSLRTIRLFFSSEVRWKAIAWFAAPPVLAPVAQRPERRQQLRRPRLHDGHLRPQDGADSSPMPSSTSGVFARLDDHGGLLPILGGAAPPALARLADPPADRPLHVARPVLPTQGPRRGRQPRRADHRGRQVVHPDDALVLPDVAQRRDHVAGVPGRALVDHARCWCWSPWSTRRSARR